MMAHDAANYYFFLYTCWKRFFFCLFSSFFYLFMLGIFCKLKFMLYEFVLVVWCKDRHDTRRDGNNTHVGLVFLLTQSYTMGVDD